MPLHESCRVAGTDPNGLVAIEKAPGIASHPNDSGISSTALLQAKYDHEAEAYTAGAETWYLLNRLDAPTSGILLLATDPRVAKAVKDCFSRHAVEKQYAALVKGVPPRRNDNWRDRLVTRKTRNGVRTQVVPGKPDAECGMALARRGTGPPARCLLTLLPRTGRSHQLRVQCASRRFPIIGDATYGDFAFNREFRRRTGLDRLFLHSWKTDLAYELDGRRYRFSAESPVPEAFSVALS